MENALQVLYDNKKHFHAMLANMGCPEDLKDDFVHDAIIKIDRHNYYDKVYSEELGVNFVYMYFILRSLYIDYCKMESRAHEQVEVDDNVDRLLALNRMYDKLDAEMRQKTPYINRLMGIKFGTKVTFRELSFDTGISITHLFHAVKACRAELREVLMKDYQHYKRGEYDKI
jgi:hypothetical protein